MKTLVITLPLLCGLLSGCNSEIEFGETDGLPPIADCGKSVLMLTPVVKCTWKDFPNKIPVRYSSGAVFMEDSLYFIDCYKGSKQCSIADTGQIVGRFDFQHDWLQGSQGFSVMLPRGYRFNQTASGRYVAIHPNAFKDNDDYQKWLERDDTPPRWIAQDKILEEQRKRRDMLLAEQERQRQIEAVKMREEMARLEREQEIELAREQAARQQREEEERAQAQAEQAKWQEQQRLEQKRIQQAYQTARLKGVPDGLRPITPCYMPAHQSPSGFSPATCMWEGMPRTIPVVRSDGTTYEASSTGGYSRICLMQEKLCKLTATSTDGFTFHSAPQWPIEYGRFHIEFPNGYLLAQTQSGKFIAYHPFAFKTDEEAQQYLDTH